MKRFWRSCLTAGLFIANLAIATLAPSAPHAGEFLVGGPVGQGSWGGQTNQPIAPTDPGFADDAFRPNVQGQEWLSSYVADVVTLPPNLNVAWAHRWYALPPLNVLMSKHGMRPQVTPVAVMQQFEDKQKRDMPALLAELDERFATLTRLANAATKITLPIQVQVGRGPVAYCEWIRRTASPPSTLVQSLYARCVQDRDAYLDQLVRRLAETAPLTTLPAPNPLPHYQLSQAIVPDDPPPPLFDFQARNQLYRSIVGGRLEAGYPALEEALQVAIDRLDASDTIRSPDVECSTILGGYVPVLFGPPLDPLSQSTANRLGNQCRTAVGARITDRLARVKAAVAAELAATLQNARNNPTIPPVMDPMAECRTVIGPHFGFESPYLTATPFPGLTDQQSADLQASCQAGVAAINQVSGARRAEAKAAVDRAAALAVDQIVAARLHDLPAPDDVSAWRSANWFPAPPARSLATSDVTTINAAGWQTYQDRWQAGTAGPRKAAASRSIEQIDKAFSDAGYTASPSVTALCSGQARSQGDIISGDELGIQVDQEAARKEQDALRAASGLTVVQAGNWITAACRAGYEQIAARRLDKAEAEAGTSEVFTAGKPLWVRMPNGDLQRFDPAKLVQDAAVDGVQISYKPGQISVTPVDHTEPRLTGRLVKLTRVDGVEGLEITDLSSLPGLDGPAATITCLALPAEREGVKGELSAAGALALGAISNEPLAGSWIARGGFDRADAARACYEAKAAFTEVSR